MNTTISPTRTYVAMCNTRYFDGYTFEKFVLPASIALAAGKPFENNSECAAWYYLNRLNSVACIEGCIAFEDYSALTEIAP